MRTYCARDGSCVGSDFWDRQLECEYVLYVCKADSCIDRLKAEGSRDSASWRLCFSKMPQVRTMHDKPGCVQT